jgi:DNA-binding MarR family transcriptional regulator
LIRDPENHNSLTRAFFVEKNMDFEDQITKSRQGRKSEVAGLLTAHGRLLIGVSQTPDHTNSQLGLRLGLSPAQIRLSVSVLESAGLLTVNRSSRTNNYNVDNNATIELHGIGTFRIAALLEGVGK